MSFTAKPSRYFTTTWWDIPLAMVPRYLSSAEGPGVETAPTADSTCRMGTFRGMAGALNPDSAMPPTPMSEEQTFRSEVNGSLEMKE